MSDKYILSIETATNLCSVSLAKNGNNVFSVVGEEPNLHATKLTVFIQNLMQKSGLSLDQLSAVAVSMGPGSYTGLRIGVSTAKGLCYGLDIPLIANNTLEALVAGYLAKDKPAIESNSLLVPMIDARRREVYTAVFDCKGMLLKETEALIIDQNSFDEFLNAGHQVILFGSGADKFTDTFENHKNIQVVTSFDSIATYQDRVSYDKFLGQQFEDVAYFEPFYLKDFVATTPKKSPLL